MAYNRSIKEWMMTFDRSITESITYNRSIKECLLDVYEKSLAEGSTYNN